MRTVSTPNLEPKERILEAAIALMRRSGFSGVGINEILAESGAPKGSMYHYFPQGKRQIVSEALAIYSRRILDTFDRNLAKGHTPGQKINALFDGLVQRLENGAYRHSCLAGTVALDLDDTLDGVRVAIAGAFADWLKVIAKHFGYMDARRSKSFAGLVLSVIEGAYIRGRAERSSRPFHEAATWLAELAEREAASAAR